MFMKKEEKTNKRQPKVKGKVKGTTRDEAKEKETESREFGGIPMRDLKKNLGCGG